VSDIPALNAAGVFSKAGWNAHAAGMATDAVGRGREVFRAQCAGCHTLGGYQAIRPLLPDDIDTIAAVLEVMRAQGETIAALPPNQPIDKSQLDYPFMPPFVGTAEELQDLAHYLASLTAAPQAAVSTRGGSR
jgi:mono/diheme cytochrome c family protein